MMNETEQVVEDIIEEPQFIEGEDGPDPIVEWLKGMLRGAKAWIHGKQAH